MLAGVALAATALAGCASDDDDASAGTEAADASAAPDQPAATLAPSADSAESPGEPQAAPTAAGIDLGRIGRDVIIELNVQMETDDIARTVAAITADAVNVGGGVASSDISYGTQNADGESNHDGHAVIVLKVPPAEVTGVVANLSGTGRVLSVNQSAQDVTEQLVDLDVRIENKRESVENVRRMMEGTTDLGQLVSLESELTARLTELEQLEAQARNLGDRVALSTITIEVRPTPAVPVIDDPADADESIGDAFREGWQAFRDIAFGIAFVLAALAPFIVTLLVAAGLAWAVMRFRRTPQARPAAMPAHDDEDELTPV